MIKIKIINIKHILEEVKRKGIVKPLNNILYSSTTP